GAPHLEMSYVQIVRNIPCQGIVPKECGAAKNLMMMAGELALGDNQGRRIAGMKDLTGYGRIIDTLKEDVSLCIQSGHGSPLLIEVMHRDYASRRSHAQSII